MQITHADHAEMHTEHGMFKKQTSKDDALCTPHAHSRQCTTGAFTSRCTSSSLSPCWANTPTAPARNRARCAHLTRMNRKSFARILWGSGGILPTITFPKVRVLSSLIFGGTLVAALGSFWGAPWGPSERRAGCPARGGRAALLLPHFPGG